MEQTKFNSRVVIIKLIILKETSNVSCILCPFGKKEHEKEIFEVSYILFYLIHRIVINSFIQFYLHLYKKYKFHYVYFN